MFFTNSKISQLSSFTVTAMWGDNTEDMNQTGSLEYGKSGLYLSMRILNPSSKGISNKLNKMFGTGVLSGADHNDEKSMTPVNISLSGLTVVNSVTNHSNGAQTLYVKYAVISAFIGDFFVTSNTKFDNLKFYPTNFSNWLQGKVNSPIYHIDEPRINQVDIKIPSLEPKQNQLTFYSKDLKFRIIRAIETQNAKEHLDHVTSAILVRNLVDFYDADADIPKLLLRNAQVNSWFQLLSTNNEFNYRVIGQIKAPSGTKEVQMFDSNVSPSPKVNKYMYISTWQQRDIGWGKVIIKSLNFWIRNYNQLIPIFNTISPSQTGNLDQRLQEECVALENIFSLSIDEKTYKKAHHIKRNKEIHYKDKVLYLLANSFEPQLVDEILTSINGIDNKIKDLDSWASLIKDIRNSLSHSTSKKYTLFIKSVCCETLKTLIRDWILFTLGINRQIINSGYIGKTFNYSSITAWRD